MNKRLMATTLLIVFAVSFCFNAFASDIRTSYADITYREIRILVNGTEIVPCDEKGASTEPFIMNDTTYLPVRAIASALGLKVSWDSSSSTVVLESGGEVFCGTGKPAATHKHLQVSITYRGTKISLDGENIPLVNRNGDIVEPFIYNDSNYLPLRVVAEALGLRVDWDSGTSTVTLSEKNDTPPSIATVGTNEQVDCYLHLQSARTWIGNGWLYSDGVPLASVLDEPSVSRIPTVSYTPELNYQAGYGLRQPIKVYDENMLPMEIEDVDGDPLSGLVAGTYYCVFTVDGPPGKIIPGEGEEYIIYKAIFRLVVDSEINT